MFIKQKGQVSMACRRRWCHHVDFIESGELCCRNANWRIRLAFAAGFERGSCAYTMGDVDN